MDFYPYQTKTRPVGDAAMTAVTNAKGTVGQFLLYLREKPLGSEIRGSEELPTSKGAMIDAFRLLISHELRAEQSGQLQKVGLYLAQFRQTNAASEVGPHDPRYGETAARMEWERMFAERDKLEKLFDLSARYARRDVSVAWKANRNLGGDEKRLVG